MLSNVFCVQMTRKKGEYISQDRIIPSRLWELYTEDGDLGFTDETNGDSVDVGSDILRFLVSCV